MFLEVRKEITMVRIELTLQEYYTLRGVLENTYSNRAIIQPFEVEFAKDLHNKLRHKLRES